MASGTGELLQHIPVRGEHLSNGLAPSVLLFDGRIDLDDLVDSLHGARGRGVGGAFDDTRDGLTQASEFLGQRRRRDALQFSVL